MYDATGIVPLEGRDELPFATLHKEPLFLHSVRTLLARDRGSGPVVTVDPHQRERAEKELARHRLDVRVAEGTTWWESLSPGKATGAIVLLDPLCPLVPQRFVDTMLARLAGSPSTALAAFRPITDTIKTVADHQIMGTIDRDDFAIITSPVVIPAGIVGAEAPPVRDFAELVGWLRGRARLDLVRAPSMARRVDDDSAVSLLECVDELGRTVHES